MKTDPRTAGAMLQKAWSEGLLHPDTDPAALFVDWDVLEHRLEYLQAQWPRFHHAIAIKSQPHAGVLSHLVDRGFGLEAASLEEVKRALDAGCAASKIVFDSPVKTRAELAWIQDNAPGMYVNVNALEELPRHAEHPRYRMGLRINPEIHTGSPALFHVSSNASKFGVALSERPALLDALVRYPFSGLHLHSGSQITDLEAQMDAVLAVVALAVEANALRKERGIAPLDWIDIGGGLPAAPWEGMGAYAEVFFRRMPAEWLPAFAWHTEFGQWVHAHAGWTASRLEYVLPRQNAPHVAYLHVGADLFLRDAYTQPRPFPLQPLDASGEPLSESTTQLYDLAGPLCFAGDYLARSVQLPVLREGDWLVIHGTGANAYGLWSRHCSRDIPAVLAHSSKRGTLEKLSDRVAIAY